MHIPVIDNVFKSVRPRHIAFWAVWITWNVGWFIWGWIKQADDPGLTYLNTLGYTIFTSRGAGAVLGVDTALLLLPLCRDLIRWVRATPVNRIMPFDESIFFHRMVAFTILFFSLVHTNAHFINFFHVWMGGFVTGADFYTIHFQTYAGITGWGMWACMILMYTSAHKRVRNRSFETFWYIHHLAFVWYICFLLHSIGCFVKTDPFWLATPQGSEDGWECKPYYSWVYNMVGFSLYILERVVREVRGRRKTTITKVVLHPAKTFEIQFTKDSFLKNYKPGQYIFVNIPEVSYFEWHPFTLTSAPEEDHISVHMRLVGDWTTAVAEAFGAHQGAKGLAPSQIPKMPTLRVDGPFGAPAEDVFNCEMVVMVAGGIGVTPFASILKSVFYRSLRDQYMPLKKVHFFWINRDRDAFEWFQKEISALEDKISSDILTLHFYLTSSFQEGDIHNIVVNDIGSEFDPVTDLRSRLNYGRPNFDQIMRSVRDDALRRFSKKDKVRVGTFYCGPSAMARKLKEICLTLTTNQVEFHFLKEHF